jgi:hypothetical protein
MIRSLGFYMTRSGRMVKITKLYENQPIAEGYIYDGFIQSTSHIWNVNGNFSRYNEHDYDIVKFIDQSNDYDD